MLNMAEQPEGIHWARETFTVMATTATTRHLVGMDLDHPTGFWDIPSRTTAIGLGAVGGGSHN
jgi:hypothetical protein